MDNRIRMIFPPLAEGQIGWKLFSEYQVPTGRDPWPWHHRLIWRVMMRAHDQVECLWHWLYDASRRFREPAMQYETRYREIYDMEKL
jgi:hypothetical protein